MLPLKALGVTGRLFAPSLLLLMPPLAAPAGGVDAVESAIGVVVMFLSWQLDVVVFPCMLPSSGVHNGYFRPRCVRDDPFGALEVSVGVRDFDWLSLFKGVKFCSCCRLRQPCCVFSCRILVLLALRSLRCCSSLSSRVRLFCFQRDELQSLYNFCQTIAHA